ncbi:isochorismate synthase [Ancylobacter sonchi]|uniref:isochorismate synthase n=1 Tax=Ancylobacter sonchi TaxID=1937790 RepID=UPI001BD22F66|nr:isochorismate synthase [Ancylobacter sonchi]MBS7532380.1 isochorismate synthase [Ancylobacter sonchi]
MNMLTRLDPSVRADATAPLPPPGGRETVFAFQSPQGLMHGLGAAAPLASGPVATLEARLTAAFHAAGADAVVAGALPFDREAADCLWQVAQVARRPAGTARPVPRPAICRNWQIHHQPDAAGYARSVRRALDIMAGEASAPDGLRKVVLSRSLLATADRDIDLAALFARLAVDPASTAFLVPLPPRDGVSRVMAGATPELLLAKNGARISSHPLAGSARRRPGDLAADAAAGAGLLRSRKDRREHAIVVEFILDTLAPWCRRLFRPQGLALTSTASMWHLGTGIEGELKDPDVSAAVLAAALHPTPAVCGVPREKAARHIAALEEYGRDFYAGTVGWCDGRGDGAWYVTIRCAEIAGRQARLFAGAGIVPGSDPLAEAEETGAKFAALLNALDIPLDHEVRR